MTKQTQTVTETRQWGHLGLPVSGSSTSGADAIVHFDSVGRLCGLFERSKAT